MAIHCRCRVCSTLWALLLAKETKASSTRHKIILCIQWWAGASNVSTHLCYQLADLFIDQDLIALNHCTVIEQKGSLFPQETATAKDGLRQSKSTSPTSKTSMILVNARNYAQQSYVVLMTGLESSLYIQTIKLQAGLSAVWVHQWSSGTDINIKILHYNEFPVLLRKISKEKLVQY